MQGMGLWSVAPPKLRQIKQTVPLTKAAKLRLTWIDYYHAHGNNAALTARHFGIAKSCFFKLEVLLQRDYDYQASASTIGRVMTKYNLFFALPVKQKGHPGRRQRIARIRKPKDFTPAQPGDLIEVDVKHLPHVNGKRYGFVAVDVITKQATVHVSNSISSAQGALAWRKAVYRLGLPKAVLTDNGSENMGAFAALLQAQPTEHYWARPHTPKDKPHVERFIGSLERECLQWGGVSIDTEDQQAIINQWLVKYHSYRPHQALGYLTPDEYKAKLNT